MSTTLPAAKPRLKWGDKGGINPGWGPAVADRRPGWRCGPRGSLPRCRSRSAAWPISEHVLRDIFTRPGVSRPLGPASTRPGAAANWVRRLVLCGLPWYPLLTPRGSAAAPCIPDVYGCGYRPIWTCLSGWIKLSLGTHGIWGPNTRVSHKEVTEGRSRRVEEHWWAL